MEPQSPPSTDDDLPAAQRGNAPADLRVQRTRRRPSRASAHAQRASGTISAVVWEKVGCYDQPVQSRLNKASIDFLDSFGFEHFRMEDEDLGGQLLPLEGKDVLRNVYSLSRHFPRSERY